MANDIARGAFDDNEHSFTHLPLQSGRRMTNRYHHKASSPGANGAVTSRNRSSFDRPHRVLDVILANVGASPDLQETETKVGVIDESIARTSVAHIPAFGSGADHCSSADLTDHHHLTTYCGTGGGVPRSVFKSEINVAQPVRKSTPVARRPIEIRAFIGK